MNKYLLLLKTAIIIIFVQIIFSACDNKKEDLKPEVAYKLTGKIDPTRTTIPNTNLVLADFVITYNVANSFGDAQSIFDGNLSFTGYTGITDKDTISLFATQNSGPIISYLTVPAAKLNTTSKTNVYNYFNGPSATFSVTKFPFTNDITAALKDGKAYFRIGKFPKYVYIMLDEVAIIK